MALALASGVAFLPAATAASAHRRQRQQLVLRAAAGGFGGSKKTSGSGGSGKQKQPRLARFLEKEVAAPGSAAAAAAEPDGWVEMPDVDAESTFASKPIKALILKTGRAVCLYKPPGEGTIYASDASSTAYKYPLADAAILNVKGKAAVEVPLDGTVYDLATGKVLSWCPKNTVVRKVLGGLKDKSEPVDLPVYPVKVEGRKVFVKFVKG